MTPEELSIFRQQVAEALANNPNIDNANIDSVIDAYMSNDWSGVIGLSGMPFTEEQQQAAVDKARQQLAPAFEAQADYERSIVEDQLEQQRQGLDQFREDEELAFEADKNAADQSSADRGVLFSGSRYQKLNNLRDIYQNRDARKMDQVSSNIGSTARDYQYRYGDQAAQGLRDMYQVPGRRTFDANVAGGKVRSANSLSSAYNPQQFNFQGTTPVSQKAAVQTRASGFLQNRANKLTSSGYKNKL